MGPRRGVSLWIAISVPLVSAGFLGVAVAASGVAVPESTRIGLVLCLQVLLGMGLWLNLRRNCTSPIEALGMGLTLGVLLQIVLSQIVIVATLNTAVTLCCEGVLAVALLLAAWFRRRLTLRVPRKAEILTFLATQFIGFAWLSPIFNENRVSPNFPNIVNGIAPYYEAVAQSVRTVGPFDSLLTPGGNVRWHWFGHAWVGALDTLGQASPFTVQTHVLPLVACLALGALAWSCARSLVGGIGAPFLASLMTLGGGALALGVIDSGGALTNLFSISTLVAFVGSAGILCLWCIGLTEGWSVGLLFAAGLLGALTVGSRVSTGLLVAATSIAMLLIGSRFGWRTRELVAPATATAVGVGIGLSALLLPKPMPGIGSAAAWTLSANMDFIGQQGLVPDPSPWGIGIGVAAIAVAACFPLGGLPYLWLSTPSRTVRLLVAWAATSAALGLSGVLLTYQPGASQFTFLAAGMLPGLTLSGVGAGVAIAKYGPKSLWRWAATVAAGSALAVGGLALSAISGMRFDGVYRTAGPFLIAATTIGIAAIAAFRGHQARSERFVAVLAVLTMVVTLATSTVAYAVRRTVMPYISSTPVTWSEDDLEAGSWLQSNVALDELVATNRQCDDPAASPPLCDSYSFNISALAARRAYSEGVSFSVGTFLPGEAQSILDSVTGAQKRMESSMNFATAPGRDNLRTLWRDGVRYMWIDSRYPHANNYAPFATTAFESGDQVILRLQDPDSLFIQRG